MANPSEEYTDDKKAYLTYDPSSVAKARFLYEKNDYQYHIHKDGVLISKTKRINQIVADALIEDGFEVEKTRVVDYTGKRIFISENGTRIPIIARQIKVKHKLNGIRVRVTAPTHDELMKRIDMIRDTMIRYGQKPKMCIWDKTGNI